MAHTLKQIQERFVKSMHDRDDLSKLDWVSALPCMDATMQLSVYYHSYTGNIEKALLGQFERCGRLMGEEFWQKLIQHFVKVVPCQSNNFIEYGLALAEFVEAFEPLQQYPYLADMIRLECAFDKAYHGEDARGLDAMKLSQQSDDEQSENILCLQDCATLVQSNHPILQLWQICDAEDDGKKQYQLNNEGDNCIVWRKAQDIRIDKLTKLQWEVLSLVEGCVSMESLFDKMTHITDDCSQIVVDCVQNGWITMSQ